MPDPINEGVDGVDHGRANPGLGEDGDRPERLGQLDGLRVALGAEPLRIGTAFSGAGLQIGDTPIDGAKIRNLFEEVGGDPLAYASALIGMSPA